MSTGYKSNISETPIPLPDEEGGMRIASALDLQRVFHCVARVAEVTPGPRRIDALYTNARRMYAWENKQLMTVAVRLYQLCCTIEQRMAHA